MNTCIEYLYRDASNYKKWQCAIIQGEFTESQKQTIRNSLQDGEYFYPSQVGLPEERLPGEYDDDPDWFEFCEENFVLTRSTPTVCLTPTELTENFLAASVEWGNHTVTESDLEEMVYELRRILDKDADSGLSCSRCEAVNMEYREQTMHNPMVCPFCGEQGGEVIADDCIDELYMHCRFCSKDYIVVYDSFSSMYDEEKMYTDIADVIEVFDDLDGLEDE